MASESNITMGLVIFLVFIILLLFVYVWSMRTLVPDPPIISPSRRVKIPFDPGASSDGITDLNNGVAFSDQGSCERDDRRVWGKGSTGHSQCLCRSPFYGPRCERESYDNRYLSAGHIEEEHLEFPTIEKIGTTRLSFQVNNMDKVCTGICDQDSECQGVHWDADHCDLLKGQIRVTSGHTPTIDLTHPANLYIKEGHSLIFQDRVFVFNRVPPSNLRYWDRDNLIIGLTSMRALYIGTVTKIENFIPNYVINNTNSIGYYKEEVFTSNDLPPGPDSNWIIHERGTSLTIPMSWKSPIWGLYVPIIF